MQPTSQPVGEAKPNGSPADALPDGAKGLVNGDASSEMHELLAALQAVRVGDFSVRMAGDKVGIAGKIADTFNEIVAANERMAKQLERVDETVGRQGKTR